MKEKELRQDFLLYGTQMRGLSSLLSAALAAGLSLTKQLSQ